MKIAIAEDDMTSRIMLTSCIQSWGYEVFPVVHGPAALELLAQEDGPRLALLDWEMPEMDGIDVCRKLRAVPGLPFRYLIVLTGREREEDIVLALEAGADDFISKPWTPGELRARLGVGQRMVQLHEQLEEHQRILAVSAQTDYLTQIWNRSAVLKRLEEELDRARREGASLGVLMLDIDHFKRVNDTYGHTAGDQVLIAVSQRLLQGCRTYDLAGRYGGEEFLAVLSRASHEDTEMIAQRLRESVAATPIQADGSAVTVTVSIGAVWLAPGIVANSGALVKAADEMLYQAKEHGRNCVMLRTLDAGAATVRER